MSEVRCNMSDLYVSECGHCRGVSTATRFEEVVEFAMLARLDGRCPICGDDIIAGVTVIGRSDDTWVCEGCFR